MVSTLTPGDYELRPRDHIGNLMRVLRTPPSLTYTKVTFPEGFTLEKMSQRLSAKLPRTDPVAFMTAVTDGSIKSPVQGQPEGLTSLEGLLFPDTYQISADESPSHIAQRMVDLMDLVLRQEDVVAKAYPEGLTAYQVLIIASMIEREAKVDEDRPKIARVILNRLALGMPLQIDATLAVRPTARLVADGARPDRHAVQHLHAHRSAAHTDRQPRSSIDPGGGQPGARPVAG